MNRIEPHITSFGATDRRDAWWIYPLSVAIGFSVLGTYLFVAAALNGHYEWGGYLSPLYSPLLKPSWYPDWLSPAFLILAFPLGFRGTCYYYRKAYYRSFFFHPPGCAVGEGRSHRYSGERAFPWVLQNMHRFFLYAAIVFIFILAYDAALAHWFPLAAPSGSSSRCPFGRPSMPATMAGAAPGASTRRTMAPPRLSPMLQSER